MATAREEAERLVAAALAAASFASRAASRRPGSARDGHRDQGDDQGPTLDDLAGLANLAMRFLGGRPPEPPPPAAPAPTGHHIATGSAECCICPICRAIAAIRDPSPEFAERLASGASDLAAGLTSILRAFGEAARRGQQPSVMDIPADAKPEEEPSIEADEPPAAAVAEDEGDSAWPDFADFGNVWQAATRVQDDRRPTDAPAPTPMAKKAVAKKAVAKKAVAKKAVASESTPATAVAETAAAKTAPANKAPAKKAPAKTAVAKKAPAKKATAKKAVPMPTDPPGGATRSETTGAEPSASTARSAKKSAAKKTPAKKAKPK
jgi:hypothetical protein